MTSIKRYEGPLGDEVFVGNLCVGEDLSELVGVAYRVGEQAYTIHGEEISPNYMLPLYVKKKSYNLYNSIMEKLSQKARYGG